jgi:hypothetical protein
VWLSVRLCLASKSRESKAIVDELGDPPGVNKKVRQMS